MIITRYLVREILKTQTTILFILFLVFFCQKLVKILGSTVASDIPINIVLTGLGLSIPIMAQLILPLSLVLAILITLGRLYSDHEIIVMHACGLGKRILMQATMSIILLTMLIASINSGWIGPWSARYQYTMIQNARMTLSERSLIPGQFQKLANGNIVFFVQAIRDNSLKEIFLTQLHQKGNSRPYIVTAEYGHIKRREDGAQIITLNNGVQFEGTVLFDDFRITSFKNYQAIIYPPRINQSICNTEQMSFPALWLSDMKKPDYRSELHWRLTLVFSVFAMGLIAVPLSTVNARHGRLLSMLPAILLYLAFFLLQSLMQSSGKKGYLNPALSMWLINLTYLGIGIILNIWDTMPVRRLRERFICRDII
ncbi:Lipopolysaccharide export system permease protein LptF [Candidatus Erwinia haradaeae]|uniref:Lipopolysaccharide export system permease protein LptF n=1 Tax=Candidatus Erwinia haradaeae TaxID=1922217 RepID=A0A451DLC1_9GAMM|nr:LPS export ABC transporter permease LptF [Candidatus Erwinia haradaeae]VFP87521.1 Lipopolysaccharide export system permease protein LptF [Candidatus Erwinia haradaeae]